MDNGQQTTDKRQKTRDKRRKTKDKRRKTSQRLSLDIRHKKNEKTSIYNNSIIYIGNLVQGRQRDSLQHRHGVYIQTAIRQCVYRPPKRNNHKWRHRIRKPYANRISLQTKNRHPASAPHRHHSADHTQQNATRKRPHSDMDNGGTDSVGNGLDSV